TTPGPHSDPAPRSPAPARRAPPAGGRPRPCPAAPPRPRGAGAPRRGRRRPPHRRRRVRSAASARSREHWSRTRCPRSRRSRTARGRPPPGPAPAPDRCSRCGPAAGPAHPNAGSSPRRAHAPAPVPAPPRPPGVCRAGRSCPSRARRRGRARSWRRWGGRTSAAWGDSRARSRTAAGTGREALRDETAERRATTTGLGAVMIVPGRGTGTRHRRGPGRGSGVRRARPREGPGAQGRAVWLPTAAWPEEIGRSHCLHDARGQVLDADAAERPYYAASTIKLHVLLAALREAAGGRLDLSGPVPATRTYIGTDGAPFTLGGDHLDPTHPAEGQPVAVRDL